MKHSRHIFLDTTSGEEMILPVTPSSWKWGMGNAVGATQVEQIGAVHLAGRPTLTTETIIGMFPIQRYAFCEPEAVADPEMYIKWFQDHAVAGTVLRYIVTGTSVNAPVIISGIVVGQSGGSGNVDYTLTLKEYRPIATPVVEKSVQPVTAGMPAEGHVVVSGDSLWMLCQRYYGQASTELCQRVASHNCIPNISIITAGQVIEFPPIAGLTANKVPLSQAQQVAKKKAVMVPVEIRATGSQDAISVMNVSYTDENAVYRSQSFTALGQWQISVPSGSTVKVVATPKAGVRTTLKRDSFTYKTQQRMLVVTPTKQMVIEVKFIKSGDESVSEADRWWS